MDETIINKPTEEEIRRVKAWEARENKASWEEGERKRKERIDAAEGAVRDKLPFSQPLLHANVTMDWFGDDVERIELFFKTGTLLIEPDSIGGEDLHLDLTWKDEPQSG